MRKIKTWILIAGMAVAIYFCMAFRMNSSAQGNYYLMPECPVPTSGQRVLVFSPHPDDESLAVGGYIYTACQAGASVRIVLVTDGNRYGLRNQRYQEFITATRLLQVDNNETYFWDYPDGKLAAHLSDLQPQVNEEIARYQPDYVLYPHPKDTHPDHAALGRAVDQALTNQAADGRIIIAYAYLVHFKYYPEPQVLTRHKFLMPPVALTLNNGVWYKFPLSTQAEQAKRLALHKYRTQELSPLGKPLFMAMMRHNELLISRTPSQ